MVYKKLSKAQVWARQRNSAGWRLKGILSNLKNLYTDKTLLQRERIELSLSIDFIKSTVDKWQKNNKESKQSWMSRKPSE